VLTRPRALASPSSDQKTGCSVIPDEKEAPLTKTNELYHNSFNRLPLTAAILEGEMKDLDGKAVKLKGELTLIAFEESGTILDVEKRCYYDLNDTAFLLTRRMEEGCPYPILVAELVAEFDVSGETARIDVGKFINEVTRRDLVVIAEGKEASMPTGSKRAGVKPYQPPVLECQRELAVASGAAPFTIDV